MIDTRKAINFANLRPEELEPRLELQLVCFGTGAGDPSGAPGFAGGDGTTAGGPGFAGGDGTTAGGPG